MQQMDLFEVIFGDATLVDIDLSAWDKQIALYVLADHAGRTANNKLPMFLVEFRRVRQFNIKFSHLDTHMYDDHNQHMTWRIDSFQVNRVPDGVHIVLSASALFPRITIVCDRFDIREFPQDIPNRLFPGWAKPYKGLIRPGLADWPHR